MILAQSGADTPHESVLRASLDQPLDADLLDQMAIGLAELIASEKPVERNGYLPTASAQPSFTPAKQIPARVSRTALESSQTACGFQHLRATYQAAVRDDTTRTSMFWQAMMLGANTMLETMIQGADLLRRVRPMPNDPYARLTPQPTPRPMARFFRSECQPKAGQCRTLPD